MLRKAQNLNECAFGWLKARCKFLPKDNDLKPETVPPLIYKGCLFLYNFCERQNVDIDEAKVKVQMESVRTNEEAFENLPNPICLWVNGEGDVILVINYDYNKNKFYIKENSVKFFSNFTIITAKHLQCMLSLLGLLGFICKENSVELLLKFA